MQSNENQTNNNGYFNNPYILDTKLYIAAIVAALGLIFLFSFPFINFSDTSYTEFFQDVYDNGEIFVCFVTILLVIMPISYAGYLTILFRAPKMYIKYMEEGSIYKAQRLLHIINNNSTNKKVSIIYIIPVVFWIFFSFLSVDRNINPLKDMGSGFLLYSLCMIGMVFLIYTSRAPSLQTVADQYAESKGESKKDDVHEINENNNWICPNPACNAPQKSNSKYCEKCGTKRPFDQPVSAQANYYSQSMKWYKFVINVQLIFAAIIDALTGLLYLLGKFYDLYYAYLFKSTYQTMSDFNSIENISEQIYYHYDGLRSIDIFFGIMLICLAVFNIYVKSQLVKYKRNAPTLFLFNVILINVIGFVYMLLVANYTQPPFKVPVTISSVIIQIIGVTVWVVLNKIYFDKRRHLFVN